MVSKAVIPAAGFGTRFLPATKAQPKEMLPVVDKPAIQYVVEEAVAAGLDDILIITSGYKKSVEDHFDRAYELEASLEAKGKTAMLDEVRAITDLASVHFIRQGEALGLGHAVGMAARHVGDEPFVVMLPDELLPDGGAMLRNLVDTHEQTGGSVVALTPVPDDEVSAYGVLDPADGAGPWGSGDVVKARGIVEKPSTADAPSNLIVTGRYLFNPEIFRHIAELEPGAGGELQLTDAMAKVVDESGLYGYVHAGTKRYDVGQKLDFLRATVELGLDHPEVGAAFAEVLREIVAERGMS